MVDFSTAMRNKNSKEAKAIRVCPNCGFVELEWRINRWRPYVEYRWASEVQIGEKLKDGGVETDKFFAYRLAGKGKTIIERVPIQLYNAYRRKAFSQSFEHAEHFDDPFQKKLVGEEAP